jgi:hypothetical protein
LHHRSDFGLVSAAVTGRQSAHGGTANTRVIRRMSRVLCLASGPIDILARLRFVYQSALAKAAGSRRLELILSSE